MRINGEPVRVPCGDCIGCRLEYSRQWGIRALHESKLHAENCFATLTYNDEHLPADKSIDPQTLRKFIRKLRKKLYPKTIRFFGCGEYGDRLGRPHYHLLIFGHDFKDKVIVRRASVKGNHHPEFRKGENNLYKSPELAEIWEKGFVTLGEVSLDSASYVARYCTKKINGPRQEKHYDGKHPEFAVMSRMPGLGQKWIEKYWKDVYPKDFFTLNGKKMRPIKYYDRWFQRYCADHNMYALWDRLKYERSLKAKNETSLRNHQKALYRQSVTKTLTRKMETDL